MMFKRTMIATQLIGLLVVTVFGTLGVSYYLQVNTLRDVLVASERDKLTHVTLTATAIIEEEAQQLEALSKALQHHADLIAGVADYRNTGDIDPIRQSLDGLYRGFDLSFLEIYNTEEVLIHRSQAQAGNILEDSVWGVYEALIGEALVLVSKDPLGLIIRAIAPVYDGEQVVAAVAVGTVFDDQFARKIARETQSDIFFASETTVWASSLPPAKGFTLDALPKLALEEKMAFFDEDLDAGKARIAVPRRIVDETFNLIVQIDINDSLALLEENQQRLSYVSLVLLVLALTSGSVFTLHLVRPLKQLKAKALALVERFSGQTAVLDKENEIYSLVKAFDLTTITLANYTRDLEEARDVAETAHRAKAQFLANMSHEIRTPMNGVIGMLELLLATQLGNRQRHLAETARNSGEALLNVINDILDFSKIEAGKLDLEDIAFDLQQLVEDVLELLAEQAHSKGLEIASRFAPTVPNMVCGDPGRLRQIVTNLVGNAVKFTKQGEITLSVEPLPEDVNRKAKNASESHERFSVKISVTDTGCGISQEVQQRLFSAFSQADASTTRKYGGTGLGLAICRQLIKLMGGEIGVTSVLGKGSTFWFTLSLPIVPDAVVATPRNDLIGVRILIVEDNATNRDILESQVKVWGMQSSSAVDGEDALGLLRAGVARGNPFDVALIDMKMPVMNGLELVEQVKADPRLSGTRLVILTSLTSQGEASAARQAGCQDWLTKPVRQAELYRCLTKVMGVFAGVEQPSIFPKIHNELPQLQGRVLLVEDNPVNQLVAQEMLTALGCQVKLADNGYEAVTVSAEDAFHVILMDCQMPGMDGFEATQRIRLQEAERPMSDGMRMHVPIIALTANALQGDREQCLAAGMDDYLAKPFSESQMRAVLQRWLPQRVEESLIDDEGGDAQKPGEDTVATLENQKAPALDAEVLAKLRDLGKNGDLLKRLAAIYLENATALMEQLRTAVADRHGDSVRQGAHAFKSSSANVGALGLAALCVELEAIGRSGILNEAEAVFGLIELEYERVRDALQFEKMKM